AGVRSDLPALLRVGRIDRPGMGTAIACLAHEDRARLVCLVGDLDVRGMNLPGIGASSFWRNLAALLGIGTRGGARVSGLAGGCVMASSDHPLLEMLAGRGVRHERRRACRSLDVLGPGFESLQLPALE